MLKFKFTAPAATAKVKITINPQKVKVPTSALAGDSSLTDRILCLVDDETMPCVSAITSDLLDNVIITSTMSNAKHTITLGSRMPYDYNAAAGFLITDLEDPVTTISFIFYNSIDAVLANAELSSIDLTEYYTG